MTVTLRKKIREAKRLLRDVLRKHERPICACSFGKNSMVVLHMLMEYQPSALVMFNNTLVEYPDTYAYKKRILNEWGLNLVETKPAHTFWWIVSKFGFPLFSRKGHSDATKNCCRYLKEYPIEKVLRRYKCDLYLTGLSRYESRLREFSARKYGEYFYSRKMAHWKCHPIQNWTTEDVWEYHSVYNIPRNTFYDREIPDGFDLRTGCWCCTIPIKYGKSQFLRVNYPRLWELLLHRGLGRLLLEKKLGFPVRDDDVDYMMKAKPCIFDKYY